MAKLICVQLETCHANQDGVAWYAYYEGEPTPEELLHAFDDESLVEKCGLGRLGEDRSEEVPNLLSERAGLRRYFVDAAC